MIWRPRKIDVLWIVLVELLLMKSWFDPDWLARLRPAPPPPTGAQPMFVKGGHHPVPTQAFRTWMLNFRDPKTIEPWEWNTVHQPGPLHNVDLDSMRKALDQEEERRNALARIGEGRP